MSARSRSFRVNHLSDIETYELSIALKGPYTGHSRPIDLKFVGPCSLKPHPTILVFLICASRPLVRGILTWTIPVFLHYVGCWTCLSLPPYIFIHPLVDHNTDMVGVSRGVFVPFKALLSKSLSCLDFYCDRILYVGRRTGINLVVPNTESLRRSGRASCVMVCSEPGPSISARPTISP